MGGDAAAVGERQPRRRAGREAGARPAVPLHRRAALVAVALRVARAVRHRVERPRRVELGVGQRQLVAVVEERRPAQVSSISSAARARLVAARPARGEPACVVVGAVHTGHAPVGSFSSIASTSGRSSARPAPSARTGS